MKFSEILLNLFYLILLFSNCIREFDPPSQGYKNLLVVEAFLSDGNEQFEVKLSRSTPIDTIASIPESGANVSISNETGEEYFLQESSNKGIYFYSGIINPQIGKSYQIHIQTQNGSLYESAPVTMRKTPKIDSVTFNYEPRPASGLEGVQIYVNTHDPSNNTKYYRWEWKETWQFRTQYNTLVYWDEGEIKPLEEQIYICWSSGKSTSIELFTSSNLAEDIVADYPLSYVNTKSEKLKMKYSINVKQYALSKESYNYWKELQKSTESLGTLFDPQPTIIKGNIYNTVDDGELVLGYFDAASVSEERIFIKRSDLPLARFSNRFNCTDSIVSRGSIGLMLSDNWWLVEEIVIPPPTTYLFTDSRYCADCTLSGTNIEPDFWQ